MADALDGETIVKFAGVFAAALIAINAFEYLAGAIARGEILGDAYAVLSILLLVVLFVALIFQSRRGG